MLDEEGEGPLLRALNTYFKLEAPAWPWSNHQTVELDLFGGYGQVWCADLCLRAQCLLNGWVNGSSHVLGPGSYSSCGLSYGLSYGPNWRSRNSLSVKILMIEMREWICKVSHGLKYR